MKAKQLEMFKKVNQATLKFLSEKFTTAKNDLLYFADLPVEEINDDDKDFIKETYEDFNQYKSLLNDLSDNFAKFYENNQEIVKRVLKDNKDLAQELIRM